MMKCCLPSEQDVGHFVNEEIQLIDGVRDSFTTIAFKAFS
jgi:DNA-binding Lrp family transcriptional regulator